MSLLSSVAATSRTILAPGAIACAYSTSSVVSPCQSARAPDPSVAPVPRALKIVNAGGAGRLKIPSKVARSCLMSGLPYGSTMTMVWPLPSRCDGKLYAWPISRGP